MHRTHALRASLIVMATSLLGACSSNPTLFGTEPPVTTQSVATRPQVDPACVALNSKIESLRHEGAADRVAKAASGKSATVNVKRTSLAKVAELDATNKEFQNRCSTIQPAPMQSAAMTQAPAAPVAAAQPPAAPAAVKTAVKKAAIPAAAN